MPSLLSTRLSQCFLAATLCLASASCGDKEPGGDGRCATWQKNGTAFPGDFDQDPAVVQYFETCRTYGIQPSTDVLNRLQLGVRDIVIEPSGSESFSNRDLRALAALLLYGNGEKLLGLRSLDVSRCSLGPSSMLLIAVLLRHPSCCLESLDVSYQEVGLEGTRALADAIEESCVLSDLFMHSSGLGDEGGQIIAALLSNSSKNRFRNIDIQNNFISPPTCTRLVTLAARENIVLKLNGNRVNDEVWNAVTHGIGELMALAGTVLMARRVLRRQTPTYCQLPCAAYCASVNILYLSSTLYHALFALGQETVYIFSILDYSGIFLLIAGSYSPFLGILFHGELWARVLLGCMWMTALLGILTAAFYRGPGQTAFRLSLFLTMGWSAVICLGRIARKLGNAGTGLLVGGGVMYTVGVPWFVRNRHTFGFPDHAIWHIWVVLGSLSHYLCVYLYVLEPAVGTTEVPLLELDASTSLKRMASYSSSSSGD